MNMLFYLYVCMSMLNMAGGFNIDVKDAVTIQGNVETGSYFGYAVGLTKNDGNRWILVGAPRSNDPNMPDVSRPGAVFACPPPTQGVTNCQLLNIDSNTGLDVVNFGGGSVTFSHGKTDSWLGGSIDVSAAGSSGRFVTCAPKWYNTYFLTDRQEVYMQGMCYEIPLDFNMANVVKIPALTRDGKRSKTLIDHAIWNYGYGGMGMSIHYTKTDHLLLGAPGLLDWIGGFVDMEGDTVKVMDNVMNNTDITKPYIGYSSTSGTYFADGLTYFAFGAPRENMDGMVVFFRAGEDTYVLQNAAMFLKGSDEENRPLPVDTYYGATLCTMDVNNDNVDDLLVAAPLYSPFTNDEFTPDLEIGIVFVYLGSSTLLKFQTPPQLIRGEQPNGRFGSAIANLGDINSDTFSDVAVGAPYEDDMKGAVYIYNGFTDGVWPSYSQRILASDLSTGFRGFGISIVSGADINSDDINDMVVGSYLSDQAVVLFGQPVIQVSARLNVLDNVDKPTDFIEVDENLSKYVMVCFRYNDRRCGDIGLNVTVNLDTTKEEKERLKFERNNLASLTVPLQIFNGDLQCTRMEPLIVKSTNDLVSGIEVHADYAIEDINCHGLTVSATINRFNGASPGEPLLQLKRQLQFRNDCPNNICKTDLTLAVKAEYIRMNGFFVIGNQDLVVDVTVTKTGNSAYGSVFVMVYPNYLGYKNMENIYGREDISCSLLDRNDTDVIYYENESAISCLFGNPMRNDTGIMFRLFMKVPVYIGNSPMALKMQVATLSEELVPADNNRTILINVRHNLDATFTGISTQEEIYLGEISNHYEMEHIYELYNKGPSLLQSASVTILFPQVQKDGHAVLFLNTTKIQCEQNCDVVCVIRKHQAAPKISSFVNNRLVFQTEEPTSVLPEVNTADCTQQVCSSISCTVTNIHAQTSVVVYLEFVLDRSAESLFTESTKSVMFVSSATAHTNNTLLISSQTEFSQQLVTSLRRRVPAKEELPWWIILVSIIGGILLIVVIALILWKVGFFKRKRREELQFRKSRMPDTGNVTTGKQRDSYTDSEGGIIDHEQAPANTDTNTEKEKY